MACDVDVELEVGADQLELRAAERLDAARRVDLVDRDLRAVQFGEAAVLVSAGERRENTEGDR